MEFLSNLFGKSDERITNEKAELLNYVFTEIYNDVPRLSREELLQRANKIAKRRLTPGLAKSWKMSFDEAANYIVIGSVNSAIDLHH